MDCIDKKRANIANTFCTNVAMVLLYNTTDYPNKNYAGIKNLCVSCSILFVVVQKGDIVY